MGPSNKDNSFTHRIRNSSASVSQTRMFNLQWNPRSNIDISWMFCMPVETTYFKDLCLGVSKL